jgi:cardiolipin synthase
MARSLIVFADDSAKPIVNAIESASRTLRIKVFVFSDPSLLKAVIAARRRGVQVSVMLNPARRNGEHENEATRKTLERAILRASFGARWTTRVNAHLNGFAVCSYRP